MADLKPTEFLRFEERPNDGMRTQRFTVRSARHHDVLGGIRWFGRWRQYVFEPALGTTFNNECLVSIADRLSYLNTMHRPARAALQDAKGEPMTDAAAVLARMEAWLAYLDSDEGEPPEAMWQDLPGGSSEETGQHLLRLGAQALAQQTAALAVDEKLLVDRTRLLDAIPECPVDGSGCVPHAIEWVERMRAEEAANDRDSSGLPRGASDADPA